MMLCARGCGCWRRVCAHFWRKCVLNPHTYESSSRLAMRAHTRKDMHDMCVCVYLYAGGWSGLLCVCVWYPGASSLASRFTATAEFVIYVGICVRACVRV